METIAQYHQRKERQEKIEMRIISGFLIICLFIICPMLAHYL